MVTEYSKTDFIRTLKRAFWDFPTKAGWLMPSKANPTWSSRRSDSAGWEEGWEPCAYPSDAVGGNVLEAINTTLNYMNRHYVDR